MTYSKFSNTVKFRMGKMDFSVNQISPNGVSLTWKKIDRCAENDETAVCLGEGDYDNLMKNDIRINKVKANDIEMMLYAYNITKGSLFASYQYYKTYNTNQISKVIVNTHDEQVEIH